MKPLIFISLFLFMINPAKSATGEYCIKNETPYSVRLEASVYSNFDWLGGGSDRPYQFQGDVLRSKAQICYILNSNDWGGETPFNITASSTEDDSWIKYTYVDWADKILEQHDQCRGIGYIERGGANYFDAKNCRGKNPGEKETTTITDVGADFINGVKEEVTRRIIGDQREKYIENCAKQSTRQLEDALDDLNFLVDGRSNEFEDLQNRTNERHNSINSSISKLEAIDVKIRNLQIKVDKFKTEFLGQEHGEC